MITNGVPSEDNLSCYVEVLFKLKNGTERVLTKLTVPFTSDGVASLSLQGILPVYPTPISADSLQNGTPGIAENHAGIYRIRAAEQWGYPAVANLDNQVSSLSNRVVYGQSRFGYGFGPVASSFMLHSYYSDNNLSFTRQIRADQPEYLYVYAYTIFDVTPTVTLYYTDDSQVTETATAITMAVHQVNYIPVALADLNVTVDASKELSFYILRLAGLPASSNKLVFYQLDDHCSDYDHYLLYDNGIGGCEVLRCSGKKDYSMQATKTSLRVTRWANNDYQQGLIRQSSAEGQQTITVNTGYYSREYCDHLSQLLLARAWHIDRTRNICYAIMIEDTEILTSSEEDDLHSIEITYRLSWERSSMSTWQPSIQASV
jgi:hypothetical protein